MLTIRDQHILSFINDFGGITTEQAAKMFFRTKCGYDVAKRRLKKMCQEGFIKSDTDFLSGKKVYYIDKKPSSHTVMLLNLYAELNYLGVECIKFDKEVKLDNVRCDALCITKYNNVAKIFIIEVDINNRTKNTKYQKLYESGLLQKRYGTFPMVLIIEKDYKRKRKLDNVKYKVVRVGYSLEGIGEIVRK